MASIFNSIGWNTYIWIIGSISLIVSTAIFGIKIDNLDSDILLIRENIEEGYGEHLDMLDFIENFQSESRFEEIRQLCLTIIQIAATPDSNRATTYGNYAEDYNSFNSLISKEESLEPFGTPDYTLLSSENFREILDSLGNEPIPNYWQNLRVLNTRKDKWKTWGMRIQLSGLLLISLAEFFKRKSGD